MYTIKVKNICPVSGEINYDPTIRSWLEVEKYFNDNYINVSNNLSVKLKLDTRSIRERLFHLKEENCDAFFTEHYFKNENVDYEKFINDHPTSSVMTITLIDVISKDNFEEIKFISIFSEILFVALNISLWGGCNYGTLEIEEEKTIRLHSDTIESAWFMADKNKWPEMLSLPFDVIWKWLEKNRCLDFVLADTPILKAISLLLQYSSTDETDPMDVVPLLHILENFYLHPDEPKSRGLNRKIPVAIGMLPSNGKHWITELYKTRSDVVHGDFPMFRPRYANIGNDFAFESEHYWKIINSTEFGLSILLATLQNLIKQNSRGFRFSEKISLEHIE